ncbi:MAG: molybdenum cofactor guanylyltransferase, partial [bacterium]
MATGRLSTGKSGLTGRIMKAFQGKVNLRMTGIILAGGENIRIGLNKALLKINGGTIIEHIIKVINPIFSQILIVTNSPKDFEFLRVKVVKDPTQGRSPLAGIYSGLIYSKNYHNFFFACDMPFINPDLIKFMIEESGDYEVIIPQGNRGFEPLHAIYSKSCLKAIRVQLESNNFKITDFFSKVRVKFINQ